MTRQTVDAYFDRLGRELSDLPSQRRSELMAEIRDHVDQALASKAGRWPQALSQKRYVKSPGTAVGLKLALSNSFGFGGQNPVIALRRFEP